jgi:hypothetical protein
MPRRIARFGVGDPLGLRSSEWSVIWNTKTSDVCVMTRIMGGAFKASLHESGRCHIKAPDPTKWPGSGSPPQFLQEWHVDPAALFVYPFGIIIPTSELRQTTWLTRHTTTIWLSPSSSSTEIGIFLTRFAPVPDQLTAAGWNRVIAHDTLPDGRQLLILVGDPELPENKRLELIAQKKMMPESLALLENPRVILVAGDNDGTRHSVETAVHDVLQSDEA